MQKSLHSNEYKALVTWLKNQRLKRGLTIRQLADKLDVAHSLVGKVEQGDRRLDVFEYVQYCDALTVKPEEGLKILQGHANVPYRG